MILLNSIFTFPSNRFVQLIYYVGPTIFLLCSVIAELFIDIELYNPVVLWLLHIIVLTKQMDVTKLIVIDELSFFFRKIHVTNIYLRKTCLLPKAQLMLTSLCFVSILSSMHCNIKWQSSVARSSVRKSLLNGASILYLRLNALYRIRCG